MKYRDLIIAFVIGTILGFAICASQNNHYVISELKSGQIIKMNSRTGEIWVSGPGGWVKSQ